MHPSTNGHSGPPPGNFLPFKVVTQDNTDYPGLDRSSLRSKERGQGPGNFPGLPGVGYGKGDGNYDATFTSTRSAATPTLRPGELRCPELSCVTTLNGSVSEKIDELLAMAGGALPGGPNDEDNFGWRKGVFRLARALQRLGFTDPNADDLLALGRAWHERLTACRCEWGDVWSELVHCWERVRNPGGLSLAEIWAQPDPTPVPAEVWHLAGSPQYEALIRGLRNLSAYAGGGIFPLSYDSAGELMGVSHTHAGRRLNALVRAGVLRLIEKGSRKKLPGSNKGTASTWLWIAKD